MTDKKEQDKEPKTTKPPETKQVKSKKTSQKKAADNTQVKKTPEKPKEKKEALKGNWDILKFPHLSEKSIANIELQNKIVFIVKSSSKRAEIKKAVETMFDVKVEKVNMLTTTKGDKKALVRLKPDYSALDIATRLGMM